MHVQLSSLFYGWNYQQHAVSHWRLFNIHTQRCLSTHTYTYDALMLHLQLKWLKMLSTWIFVCGSHIISWRFFFVGISFALQQLWNSIVHNQTHTHTQRKAETVNRRSIILYKDFTWNWRCFVFPNEIWYIKKIIIIIIKMECDARQIKVKTSGREKLTGITRCLIEGFLCFFLFFFD